MSKLMIRSAVVALAMTAGAAQAATFDFAAIADAYWNEAGREGSFAQVKGSAAGAALTDGGVEVVAANGNGEAYGFFDHRSGGKPGGLGVCSQGFNMAGDSLCSTGVSGATTSDDNITSGESLELVFSQSVSFTDLLIRDADHNKANGTIRIDGNQYLVADGMLSPVDLAALGTKSMFTFAYDDGSQLATQLYVSAASVSPIPVPAAFGLLAAALGGLGAARRRRG
jgi:hypothetical protein